MMSWGRTILCGVFLTCCLAACCRSTGMCPVGDIARLIVFWSVELEKEENHWLKLEESSVYYDGGIGSLCLRYSTTDLMEMCEARHLIVKVADGFVSLMNQYGMDSDDWMPLPYPVEKLDIVITVESLYGQYIDERYVAQIRLHGGCVTYFAFNAFDAEAHMFHKHTESFEMAQILSTAYREARALEVMPPGMEEGSIRESFHEEAAGRYFRGHIKGQESYFEQFELE